VGTKQDQKREQGIQLPVLHTHSDDRICHGVRPLGCHVKNGSYSSSSINCMSVNWNDLPYDIRACDSFNVFKRKLKTHLFNIAYPTQSRVIPAPTNNILVTYGAL